MSKSISKKKTIDASKYINVDTGEYLNSEHSGSVSSVNVMDANIVKMKSEEFVITDTRTIEYLKGILSRSDLGYVRWMIDMVYGGFNILYDKQTFSPHTKKTLQCELELANTAFYGLIKRLHLKGVLYYIEGYNNRKKVNYIMLNPTIGRRTNQIQRECLKYFEDFSVKNKVL